MHYVIGDVHGCYDDLMKLMGKIESKDPEPVFILLGDLIDRGPRVWDTLTWAMENVSRDGKYRCLLGNHEQMVVDWFEEYRVWYAGSSRGADGPKPRYDFLDCAREMGCEDPVRLEKYIAFMRSLPLEECIEVPGRDGIPVSYRIGHAWVPVNRVPKTAVERRRGNGVPGNGFSGNGFSGNGVPGNSVPLNAEPAEWKDRELRHIYLWERDGQETGNYLSSDIIVHGHTPTYYSGMHDPSCVKGMIRYRRRSVNVDGGCVYAPWYPDSVCMLCAVCLETLEEYYADTIREQVMKVEERAARLGLRREETPPEERIRYWEERYRSYQGNMWRREILDMLGQPG